MLNVNSGPIIYCPEILRKASFKETTPTLPTNVKLSIWTCPVFTFFCWQSMLKWQKSWKGQRILMQSTCASKTHTTWFPASGFCRTSNHLSKDTPYSTQHGSWAASSWRVSLIPVVRNSCYTSPAAHMLLHWGSLYCVYRKKEHMNMLALYLPLPRCVVCVTSPDPHNGIRGVYQYLFSFT